MLNSVYNSDYANRREKDLPQTCNGLHRTTYESVPTPYG